MGNCCFCLYLNIVISQKSAHEEIALQDGKGALSVFLHIATKECLCHVYSDLI